ncbi:hypothetical protein HaLaN_07699, partial [Haematococcus lacustris]
MEGKAMIRNTSIIIKTPPQPSPEPNMESYGLMKG